jgi:hypothetical protein
VRQCERERQNSECGAGHWMGRSRSASFRLPNRYP